MVAQVQLAIDNLIDVHLAELATRVSIVHAPVVSVEGLQDQVNIAWPLTDHAQVEHA